MKGNILKGVKITLMIPNFKANNNTYRRAIKLGVEVIENSEVTPQFSNYWKYLSYSSE